MENLNAEQQVVSLDQQLKEALHKHIVHFVYKKADGSERKAIGTTNLELVPETHRPKAKEESFEIKKEPKDIQPYFDITIGSWRSCKKNSILLIEQIETQ